MFRERKFIEDNKDFDPEYLAKVEANLRTQLAGWGVETHLSGLELYDLYDRELGKNCSGKYDDVGGESHGGVIMM